MAKRKFAQFLALCGMALAIIFTPGCTTLSGVVGGGGVRLPGHKTVTLKNGISVVTIRDKTLPYFTLGAIVAVGGKHDPMGKTGLANLTATLLDRGTRKRTANEIADAFGQLGTSISQSADYDYTYISTTGLSRNEDQLLELFFEVLQEPAFTVSEVDRTKSETISDIKRAYDSPRFVASYGFQQFLYGMHPYGRSVAGTVRDLQTLKQKDVIRFYLQYYRPERTSLVIAGDISDKIVDKLNAMTAKWERRPLIEPIAPIAAPVKGLSILHLDRGDLKQSEVRIGNLGVKRNIPDYLALQVAETILSGGFNSRLVREIRMNRGLTYGISADFDARTDVGPFVISTNTRHDKVGEMVTETINVLKEFRAKGVTDQEVKEAAGYMKGLFSHSMETPAAVARSLLTLQFYGVSEDYLTDFVRNIDRLTAKEVNQAVQKHFDPANLKVVVYGPKAAVIDQLRQIGTVESKNYKQIF